MQCGPGQTDIWFTEQLATTEFDIYINSLTNNKAALIRIIDTNSIMLIELARELIARLQRDSICAECEINVGLNLHLEMDLGSMSRHIKQDTLSIEHLKRPCIKGRLTCCFRIASSYDCATDIT